MSKLFLGIKKLRTANVANGVRWHLWHTIQAFDEYFSPNAASPKNRRGPFASSLSKIVFAFAVIGSAAAFACQVPVFRYALERWDADRYRITVLHDGPLNETQSAALAQFKQASESGQGKAASVDVRMVDVNGKGKLPPKLIAKWKAHKDQSSPLVMVEYPLANEVGRTEPMFQETLTKSTVEIDFGFARPAKDCRAPWVGRLRCVDFCSLRSRSR